MGFHEEIVSKNIVDCSNRNDEKSQLRVRTKLQSYGRESEPCTCRKYA